MVTQLKVGDVCVGQHMIFWPEYNGMDCTIEERLATRRTTNTRIGVTQECLQYGVRWANGVFSWCKPQNLRRKQPPAMPSGELRIMSLFKPTVRTEELA